MKLKALRPGTWYANIEGQILVADRVEGDKSYAVFENGRFRGYEYSRADVRAHFEIRRLEMVSEQK